MRSLLSLILIVAVLVLGAGTAQGQTAPEIPRIGMLATQSTPRDEQQNQAFLEGLKERGYIEGKNIIIEYRDPKGQRDLYPKLAAQLVRMKVTLIVAEGTTAIRHAMKATKTIPIVMVSGGNVVGRGFVNSTAHPGGNVTGLSSYMRGLNQRRLELFKETVPSISRVALINPRKRKGTRRRYEETAKSLGINLQVFQTFSPEELERAFAKITTFRPDALITVRAHLTHRFAKEIAEFAVTQRIPSMYHSASFVRAGGLMSYGMNYRWMWRRAAAYVDKILKGANPATLPVEPPQLELVINLKTARKIGVKIPPEILLEANEVIK